MTVTIFHHFMRAGGSRRERLRSKFKEINLLAHFLHLLSLLIFSFLGIYQTKLDLSVKNVRREILQYIATYICSFKDRIQSI